VPDILTTPPDGYVPLAQWARERGYRQDTAARAAKRGDVPGAVLVHVPGTPMPTYWVPPDCQWAPAPRGKPPAKK